MNVPKKKYAIGLTFGAFDLLHIGHLNLLRNAKELCEKLIVCVSSDAYVFEHKKHSPIVPFKERLELVAAIKYVDKVDVQSDTFGKKEAVKKYSPDILIVGDDWRPEIYEGEGLGVPVTYLPHTDGTSSSFLREKLQKIS